MYKKVCPAKWFMHNSEVYTFQCPQRLRSILFLWMRQKNRSRNKTFTVPSLNRFLAFFLFIYPVKNVVNHSTVLRFSIALWNFGLPFGVALEACKHFYFISRLINYLSCCVFLFETIQIFWFQLDSDLRNLKLPFVRGKSLEAISFCEWIMRLIKSPNLHQSSRINLTTYNLLNVLLTNITRISFNISVMRLNNRWYVLWTSVLIIKLDFRCLKSFIMDVIIEKDVD